MNLPDGNNVFLGIWVIRLRASRVPLRGSRSSGKRTEQCYAFEDGLSVSWVTSSRAAITKSDRDVTNKCRVDELGLAVLSGVFPTRPLFALPSHHTSQRLSGCCTMAASALQLNAF